MIKRLVGLLHYMKFYSLYTGGLLTRGITHEHVYQVSNHIENEGMKLYWNVVRQPLSVYHQNSNQMVNLW